jgi:hypothetical protein
MMGLRRVQRPSGQIAVDLVVQALGGREEPGVAGDHQPADRDAQVGDVPDQCLQHLGDPAAHRGRVDVPDGTPGQHVPNLVSGLDQLRIPLSADDGLQQGHRPPRHLHGTYQAHGTRPSDRAAASALTA